MPRVKPLGRDYEKDFGAELKAAIVRKRMSTAVVAKLVGFTGRTMANRFNNPADMTLGQMKRFIKVTEFSPEILINYLYESDTHLILKKQSKENNE